MGISIRNMMNRNLGGGRLEMRRRGLVAMT